LRRGKPSARRNTRARILLLAAEDRADDEVAGPQQWSASAGASEYALDAALIERPRPGAVPRLDERGQATLISLACGNPPEGRTSRTVQLLANELVVPRIVPSISDEAVRRTLKKRTQSGTSVRGAKYASVAA
jgi:hypothetical protein